MNDKKIHNDFVTQEIIEKIESLFEKAKNELSSFKLQKAQKTADEIESVSKRHNSAVGISYYYLIQGLINVEKDWHDQALNCFFTGLEHSKRVGNLRLATNFYNNIGKSYTFMKDYQQASKYIHKAIKADKNNYNALSSMGMICYHSGDNEGALKYYESALAIAKNVENNEETIRIMINIGRNHETSDPKKAMNTYQEALSLAEKHESIPLKARLLMLISSIELANKEYNSAKSNCELALKLSEQIGNKSTIGNCYHYLAQIHQKLNNSDSVIHYLNRYIAIKEMLSSEEIQHNISEIQFKSEEEKKELRESNELMKRKLEDIQHAYAEVAGIGKIGVFSEKMRQIMRMAEFFHADRNTPVLIEGETGSGKEIIARMVHYGKGETTATFITLNCSAISPTLFESELFGYEEGAFTGARKGGKPGKLELAQGGTLFLDEIGEMPLELQPKLLRVLQEKEFYRIGGEHMIKTDIRIICATNRDLKIEMQEKHFRPDLYYRLNTGRLYIPPLRERKEEIAPLAQMFLLKYAEEKDRAFRYMDNKAIELLENYSWPGNVRELQNAIERVVLLYDDVKARAYHFNFISGIEFDGSEAIDNDQLLINLPEEGRTLDSIEEEIIRKLLAIFKGNQTRVAKYLNVSRYTILRKKKKHNI